MTTNQSPETPEVQTTTTNSVTTNSVTTNSVAPTPPGGSDGSGTTLEHLAYLLIGVLAGVVLVMAAFHPVHRSQHCGPSDVLVSGGSGAHGSPFGSRQPMRGGMPDGMAGAAHDFGLFDDGGYQAVSSPTGDAATIDVIKTHLFELGTAISVGDMSGPAAEHGMAMPGIRELSASAGRFSVTFLEAHDGAVLVFRGRDAQAVFAIQLFLRAQDEMHSMMSREMGAAAGAPAGMSGELYDDEFDQLDSGMTPVAGMTEEMWRLHHPGVPVPSSLKKI